jgi:hypothetical protein
MEICASISLLGRMQELCRKKVTCTLDTLGKPKEGGNPDIARVFGD